MPGTTDTVKTILTPGEFVIRKEAVDMVGVPMLNMINNMPEKGGHSNIDKLIARLNDKREEVFKLKNIIQSQTQKNLAEYHFPMELMLIAMATFLLELTILYLRVQWDRQRS